MVIMVAMLAFKGDFSDQIVDWAEEDDRDHNCELDDVERSQLFVFRRIRFVVFGQV